MENKETETSRRKVKRLLYRDEGEAVPRKLKKTLMSLWDAELVEVMKDGKLRLSEKGKALGETEEWKRDVTNKEKGYTPAALELLRAIYASKVIEKIEGEQDA